MNNTQQAEFYSYGTLFNGSHFTFDISLFMFEKKNWWVRASKREKKKKKRETNGQKRNEKRDRERERKIIITDRKQAQTWRTAKKQNWHLEMNAFWICMFQCCVCLCFFFIIYIASILAFIFDESELKCWVSTQSLYLARFLSIFFSFHSFCYSSFRFSSSHFSHNFCIFFLYLILLFSSRLGEFVRIVTKIFTLHFYFDRLNAI